MEEDWSRTRGGQSLQSWSHCALPLSQSVFLLRALGPTALVLLFLHVFARHPLSPLCQPLTSRTVFARPETVAMVTGMALCRGGNITRTGVRDVALRTHLQHIGFIFLREENRFHREQLHRINQTTLLA